jgi:ABC-type spermidine/putrescine transport system permease subunit I
MDIELARMATRQHEEVAQLLPFWACYLVSTIGLIDFLTGEDGVSVFSADGV